MHPANPLSGNVPYFIISLCLMPDDFTLTLSNARGHQGESHSWHSVGYNQAFAHAYAAHTF
jgi:hypothetical protein